MPRRGHHQVALVKATPSHFRPHIVSEEGSRVRAVVVVLDVQVLVEVTNPNPTPTLSFVFCL